MSAITSKKSSYLEIVKDCDNFPDQDTDAFEQQMNSLWKFYLPNDSRPHRLIPDSVVETMPWTKDFRISTGRKEIYLIQAPVSCWESQCNDGIDALLDNARALKVFPNLGKKRDEKYQIVGAKFPIAIERSASSLFGIIGQGVHMTVYTQTESGPKFWIPQRNLNKTTYPGMLDNAVAGGIASGESAFECLVREAAEEAALPENYVRDNAQAAGTVTWFNVSGVRSGGETGLMNPGVLFVYDLQVSTDVAFQPVDHDIHRFHLMDLQDVETSIGEGRFKPSSACVMIDFLVRHGIVTTETEKEYVDIVSRLHRKLPFPTSPHG